MTAVGVIVPQPCQCAMVLFGGLSDGNKLGLAGAAARQREHDNGVGGQYIKLPAFSVLDVGTQPLVVGDTNLPAVIVQSVNPVETMIAAELCRAIAGNDMEQQLFLSFARPCGERLPASPLLACNERCGSDEDLH